MFKMKIKNKFNRKRSRIIVSLCLFVFMFSISPFLGLNFVDSKNIDLKTSSDNYLFKGKEYDITLADVYDDADLYKIYTGANFSTIFLENESTIFNEVVSLVNNSEKQLGDPNEFTMPYGTTDDLDNMKQHDGSYTSFYSTVLPPDRHEMPVQWTDFAFTYGSQGGTGSTEYNDGTYAYMNSASYISADTYLGFIVPNGDILTNWNEADGTPHWSKIDEAIADMNGDGGNIRESDWMGSVQDRWNFNSKTIPASSYISRLDIKIYCLKQSGVDNDIGIVSNVFSGDHRVSPSSSGYLWKTESITGLNLNQASLNSLYIGVIPYYGSTNGWVDIETIYINVYYKSTYYRHYSQITWDYAGGNLDKIENLYYDYATTVAIDMDLDIYDWVVGNYVELESNTGTGYITGTYDLQANPNKVSGTNQVKVRFETSGTTTNNFDVRIDQLMFDYVLTTDADPKLEAVMETTFSNYNHPNILGIKVESWHRTDVSQTITFSIYNYNTPSWETITNQSQTSFTQSLFQSTSVSDYFDGGIMKIRYYGTSPTQEFDLYVDNLNITITYKMDLSHSITFNTNGLWKYRWALFGSIQYTDWTYFEVIDPIPNFQAISESDLTTRWILQGKDITALEDFHDDINTDYWNLMQTTSNHFSYSIIASDDSYIDEYHPTTNYGSDDQLLVLQGDASGGEVRSYVGFNDIDSNYLFDNESGDYQIGLNCWYVLNPISDSVQFYNTSDFDESIITWNNAPSGNSLQDTLLITTTGWKYWDISDISDGYMFKWESPTFTVRSLSFKPHEHSSLKPIFSRNNIYKNYFGSGYMYMQTDISESISLISKDYGTHKILNSGDYFEIDFQTNSDSQINLILLKDGTIIKTLILSHSGNTNFNRQTVKISVNEDVEFDQLKISSVLENIDNVKVYDIKTFKYTITGDYADFYVGSNRDYEVYLTPDDYNLRISEEGNEKVNTNITIPATGVLQYIYTPIERLECRLTLFNTEGSHLDFMDYHIKVNRSLNAIYNEFWLLDSIFSVDTNTYVYISIYDRFNTLIDTFERLTSDYIDLEIEVYQLQIKNLMDIQTTIDINSTHVYPLLTGESLYFMLSKNYYKIGFYDEYNLYKNFTTYLDLNKAFQLNSSLKTIYFSMFTYDGLGIDHDLVRFYINNKRKDFGFNSMLEDTLHLLILDFFNNTLANETIDANVYDNSEYNLFVEIYSLIILNQFTYEDIIVNITQINSGVWMTQIIPKQFGLTYRFLPNVEYNITIYFTNQTFYDSRIINLTDNSHIESFGVASGTPEYPKNVYFSVYTGTGLAIEQQLVKFYIDGDRADFGFNTIEDMIVNVVVKDFFDTTLFNQIINTSGIYEYDILINIFSLKIKNEATQTANYTLKLGGLSETGNILPQEIIEYQLSPTNYIFEYTNNEDGSSGLISFNLNQDLVYIINSTYYDVYIGLYNFYGVVNRDEVKFYINDTRSDFGFNTITSEHVRLTVLDYFNSTLFDQVVKLEGLQEYNIFIEAYTLIVNNDYATQDIIVKISKGTITIERLIEAQGFTELKLFANTDYEIKAYTLDEIKFDEEDVDLDEEYKIISFGFFDEPVPSNPLPIILSYETLVWVIVFAFISIVVFVVLVFKMREDKLKNDGEPLLNYPRNNNPKGFDNRIILQENKDIYKPKSKSRY